MWNEIIIFKVNQFLTFKELMTLSKELISLDRKVMSAWDRNQAKKELVANLPVPSYVAKELNFILQLYNGVPDLRNQNQNQGYREIQQPFLLIIIMSVGGQKMIIYFVLWMSISILVLAGVCQIKEYWDAKTSQFLNQYGLHQNHLMGPYCKY